MCLKCCSCRPDWSGMSDGGRDWGDDERRVYSGKVWVGKERELLVKSLIESKSGLNRFRGEMRCWYCGLNLEFGDVRIDHVKAVSRGGTDRELNLAISCVWCNTVKSAIDVDLWLRSEKLAWRMAEIEADEFWLKQDEERWKRDEGEPLVRRSIGRANLFTEPKRALVFKFGEKKDEGNKTGVISTGSDSEEVTPKN